MCLANRNFIIFFFKYLLFSPPDYVYQKLQI